MAHTLYMCVALRRETILIGIGGITLASQMAINCYASTVTIPMQLHQYHLRLVRKFHQLRMVSETSSYSTYPEKKGPL